MAQTLVQVFTKKSTSLREAIIRDARLDAFELKVSEQKRQSRPHGWSKLHSTSGADGAINIEWDSDARMLVCRVINRAPGTPDAIVGAFIRYLLGRHRKNIEAIQVIPR